MSDPRPPKHALELNQVAAFLHGAGVPYIRLARGGDPPDIVVHRDVSPPLCIEVTEYHPQEGRVAMQMRWEEFRKAVDDLAALQPPLAGVHISVMFHDPLGPRRHHHAALAAEVVRCALTIRQGSWDGRQSRSLCFLDIATPWNDPDVLPAASWPLLASHVSQLDLSYYPGITSPLLTSNYQAQAAWCSPSGDALGDILRRKDEAVRNAVAQGRCTLNGPLWLLLVANNPNDISSFAFADERLREALDESGFDFRASVFEEVWMSEGCGPGRALRLHPWNHA